jgi:dTDP-4-dehydrorhamnose reductase
LTEEKPSHPEIWAGLECSIIRANNRYRDQLQMTGHDQRIHDLELFYELGIKTIRFPILWEKAVVKREGIPDFQYTDSRIQKLKELNIEPIAGLLHHGSGPPFTSLADPDFPALLADYAFQVADRYPWIKYYTPVNEPLTTARFSGLYGIWYPHQRTNHMFLKMFLNQIKAIMLSMKAIRSINPEAALIQTEDLSRVYSTPQLSYQAHFENERRWLTYDFLTGKFGPSHVLWNFFLDNGFNEEDLGFFTTHSCVPQVCGFNYYITSERYLDHRISRYPASCRGGNGVHRYADVEAIRVPEVRPLGLEALLTEAWHRYQLPMAITESHLGCTREEQMRWFWQNYNAAARLNASHIPVKAITAWSFLGSYDWNSLLTHENRCYEPGVYDVSSGIPQPTALAHLIKNLNIGKPFEKHLLYTPGWWNRDIRIAYAKMGAGINPNQSPGWSFSATRKICVIIINTNIQPVVSKLMEQRGLPCYFSIGCTEHSDTWAIINLEKVEKVVEITESSWLVTKKPLDNIRHTRSKKNQLPVVLLSAAVCTTTEIHTALDLLIDNGGLTFAQTPVNGFKSSVTATKSLLNVRRVTSKINHHLRLAIDSTGIRKKNKQEILERE